MLWLLPSLAIFPQKDHKDHQALQDHLDHKDPSEEMAKWDEWKWDQRMENRGSWLFNPDLSDPASSPCRTTLIPCVYVFVERLKDLQAIKGEDLVRNNIHASLRGSALDWYNS